jgi:hypothetical protein
MLYVVKAAKMYECTFVRKICTQNVEEIKPYAYLYNCGNLNDVDGIKTEISEF